MGDTDVAHQDEDRSAGVRHLLAICIISEIFRLAFKEKKLFKDGWQVGWAGNFKCNDGSNKLEKFNKK